MGDDALRVPRRGVRPAGPPAPAGRRGGARHARLRRLDLHVIREGDRSFDIRPIRVDLSANGRDLADVRREEPRHVDDGRAVRSIRVDVEHGNDRPVVGVLDGAIDVERCVGRDRKRWRAQHDAVSIALPPQCSLTELVAGILAEAASGRAAAAATRWLGGRREGVAADEQLILPQLLRRDLEVQAVADAMHREHPAPRHRLTGYDSIVRARTRRSEAAGTAGAPLLLGVGLGCAASRKPAVRRLGRPLRRGRLGCGRRFGAAGKQAGRGE